MNSNARIGPALLLVVIALMASALHAGQQSGQTVRHHKVEEQVDDPIAAQLDQAEAAMQKQNYDTAEILLMKAVADSPQSYRAWFDLGFVYGATKRPADAVSAYRKSVAAKPDVFESNLNLGLVLAKQGDNSEAAKYLKAATQLKPSAHPQESLATAWQALGRVQEQSDPQPATVAFAEAAKLAPSDPGPYLAAAALLQKQGNLEAAA